MKPTLRAELVRLDDGRFELRAPAVGLWREIPAHGSLIRPGTPIGRLEILGRLVPLSAPEGAHGLVTAVGGEPTLARRPLAFGERLLVLDPSATAAAQLAEDAPQAQVASGAGLSFRAPSSGRFYVRPAPDKAAFVEAGDVIQRGQAVAILEVMKTFNRVLYGGDTLPPRARVLRVLPADGDDLAAGDPILELEAAPTA
jgi:acetyl-CoA carboxylase biotin carboxyl carrier protein